MKLFKLKLILTFIFIISVTFIGAEFTQLHAGPLPPGNPPGGGPPCWPPPCVPINNGLVFLAFSALILAVYQLKIFRTKK
jgi:hypothetical protein